MVTLPVIGKPARGVPCASAKSAGEAALVPGRVAETTSQATATASARARSICIRQVCELPSPASATGSTRLTSGRLTLLSTWPDTVNVPAPPANCVVPALPAAPRFEKVTSYDSRPSASLSSQKTSETSALSAPGSNITVPRGNSLSAVTASGPQKSCGSTSSSPAAALVVTTQVAVTCRVCATAPASASRMTAGVAAPSCASSGSAADTVRDGTPSATATAAESSVPVSPSVTVSRKYSTGGTRLLFTSRRMSARPTVKVAVAAFSPASAR